MKKFLPLILITSLLLSACSIDWTNSKDKKIVELEQGIANLKEKNDDNLFKKNKECSEYNQKKNGIISSEDISGVIEVFYSPTRNSCIYIVWDQPYNKILEKYQQKYEIKDLFTNETIKYYEDINDYKIQEEFDQKIKELKGE